MQLAWKDAATIAPKKRPQLLHLRKRSQPRNHLPRNPSSAPAKVSEPRVGHRGGHGHAYPLAPLARPTSCPGVLKNDFLSLCLCAVNNLCASSHLQLSRNLHTSYVPRTHMRAHTHIYSQMHKHTHVHPCTCAFAGVRACMLYIRKCKQKLTQTNARHLACEIRSACSQT